MREMCSREAGRKESKSTTELVHNDMCMSASASAHLVSDYISMPAHCEFSHCPPSSRLDSQPSAGRSVPRLVLPGVRYIEHVHRYDKLSAWLATIVLLSLFAPTSVWGQRTCGVKTGAEFPKIRGIYASLGIEGTITDPTKNLHGTQVPGPHPIEPKWDADHRRQSVEVVVGSRIEFEISAAWGYVDTDAIGRWYGNTDYGNYNLSLYAYEDPGVPNGAVLTTQTCLGYPQQAWIQGSSPPALNNPTNTRICNPVRRTFTWEPRNGQENIVHSICFTVLVLERPNDCQSDYRCVDINVVAPDIQWDRSITPEHMHKYHAPVGCSFRQCFKTFDRTTLYPIDIQEVLNSFPPGARLEPACKEFPSTAVYALFPASTPYPYAVQQGPCQKCIDWVPVRGMEAQVYTLCVIGADRSRSMSVLRKEENSALRANQTCVVVEVPRCKYCVQAGDTLHLINKRYNLNSNWLQLWNVNGIEEILPDPLSVGTTFNDPDAIQSSNSIIHLGPTYQVEEGQSLVQVAKMLRTTVKKLLDINPDIKDPTAVKAGAMVCVQPCTDVYFATTKV